jgi:carboxypeptidase Taq
MRAEQAYAELIRLLREEALLESCVALLEWDEAICMPPGGAEHRSEQLGFLAGLLHDRASDPRLADLLADVEGSDLLADPLAPPAVNVREIRRLYDRSVRTPKRLVEELARVTSRAQHHWAAARSADDFPRFQPWLERIVRLKRDEAACVGYRHEPYDALLDEYEPDATAPDLERHFAALRTELVPLVRAIAGSSRRAPLELLEREFPVADQRAFGQAVAAQVGFDFERGRLDTSTHPFSTSIGPGDCRITTRFGPRTFADGFFAILHEVGHGLYEQGLAPEHHGTPMGEPPSLGIDESQARLWENAIGRSRAFWSRFFPQAARAFPHALRGVGADEMYHAVNAVQPSLIRVTADQVTYNLHVLVRFELERALINGSLIPADVPTAWNDAYRHYLGIVPTTDREGCLQDGHWAEGLIGYFPTYTLGDIFSAQLIDAADRDLGGLDALVARGEFAPLVGWLRERVYTQGSRYSSARLVEAATGSPPDHAPLLRALTAKFGELYDV